MARRNVITAEDEAEIIRAFECDPSTGVIIRRSPARWGGYKRQAGDEAGYKDSRGYIEIMLGRKRYKAHRLVWFFATGSWPNGVIDHINGDTSDNRISNLRDVSNQENTHNTRTTQRSSRLGLMGVVELPSGMFRPTIEVGDKRISLGTFPTVEEAAASYRTAKLLLHKGFISDRK